MDFDIIGNLDADLTFEPDYMAFLIAKFNDDPLLGVAGTPFIEGPGQTGYDFRFANIEHVSGACQLFRRKCFNDIGGYIPIKGGGIDWVAVTTARMKGWKTQTFIDKYVFHNRSIGTGKGNRLSARFKLGKKDYSLGNQLVWEIARAFFSMRQRPYLIGGVLLFIGYLHAAVFQKKRPISDELIAFYRSEQAARLKNILLNLLLFRKR